MIEVSHLAKRVFGSLYLVKGFNYYRVGSPLIALKVVPISDFVPQTGIVNVILPVLLCRREKRLRKKS